MLNSVTEKTLAAYKEALANFPTSHFAVTTLASVIIRLGGREGRVAVQLAQREKSAARPVLVPSQNTPEKKRFRKLEFSKKNEQENEQKPPKTFGLKKVTKTGKVTPMNQTHEEAQEELNLSQASGDPLEPTTFLPPNENSENVVDKSEEEEWEEFYQDETDQLNIGVDIASGKDQSAISEIHQGEIVSIKMPENSGNDGYYPDDQDTEDVPLTAEELEALKTMKPAAIGRSFSIGKLRATLRSLGIEYSEAHTPTILGAALLKSIVK